MSFGVSHKNTLGIQIHKFLKCNVIKISSILRIYEIIELTKVHLLNQSSFALPHVGIPLATDVVCSVSTPVVLIMLFYVEFLVELSAVSRCLLVSMAMSLHSSCSSSFTFVVATEYHVEFCCRTKSFIRTGVYLMRHQFLKDRLLH